MLKHAMKKKNITNVRNRIVQNIRSIFINMETFCKFVIDPIIFEDELKVKKKHSQK